MIKRFCKYCKKELEFEKPQQVGAHARNCLLSLKKKEYVFKCRKHNCNNTFKLFLTESQYKKGKHKKYCPICYERKRCGGRFYEEVIKLRRSGKSYREIEEITSYTKSTIYTILQKANMIYTEEHIKISLKNKQLRSEASRIIRAERTKQRIKKFKERITSLTSMDIIALSLYEAEGDKKGSPGFSNQDYRILNIFKNFIIKYFPEFRITYRLYIHEIRKDDLSKILKYWSKKLNVDILQIKISWKRNKTKKVRHNENYVGCMRIIIRGKHVTDLNRALHEMFFDLLKGEK